MLSKLTDEPSRLAHWLLKEVNKAIRDFDILVDGDHIVVAVSGGIDSLTLLHLLEIRRMPSKERYSLHPILILGDMLEPRFTIDPKMQDWFTANGYTPAIETMDLSEGETLPMNCYRCTWNG